MVKELNWLCTQRLEDLRREYPAWEINPPHFCEVREGSMAGEVGFHTRWRQWATPKNAPSRYTVTAFSPEGQGAEACLRDMQVKLAKADEAWRAEL